eukprot:gnl/TRDRNA2_/TRDRNA2_171844_c3_seq2.p1 gnl/TRDRNA2_/TRDRNA2_171844_c3~~gnl/TRDRNA2_/TRDRNA2_171844_c3_seq2.p1  ORF type:complete len:600 (-),score=60.70 gnl/TRDRNA2_/TRDRNA2_171844_c3_seq2:9-1745(-)
MAAVAWPWPLCSPSEAGLASVPLDNLRVVLNRRVADSRDAGSLCAILRSNCLPFIHRAGHAELPQKETLQPDIALDTIFRLYSMTKPLIAAVFLTLVDEGLVSLDDPLSKYLPCFATPVVQRHPPPPCCSRHQAARLRKAVDDACAAPVLIEDVDPLQLPYLVAIAGPRCVAVSSENLSGAHCRVKLVPGAACVPAACDAAVRPITLRMLLTHTSGIGYGPGIEYQSPSTEVHRRYDDLCRATERGDVANLADWVVRLAEIPLLHQPGERFLYSYSLDVLGRVVEVVADGKLQEIAETRIFKPLGMVDTSFDVAPEALHRLAALYKHRRTGKDNLDKRHGARAGVPTLDLVDPRGKVSGWAAGSASHVVSAGGGVELVRGGAVGTLVDYLKFCAMLLAGGVAVGGRRILSQSLIEVALQDHLAKAEHRQRTSMMLFWLRLLPRILGIALQARLQAPPATQKGGFIAKLAAEKGSQCGVGDEAAEVCRPLLVLTRVSEQLVHHFDVQGLAQTTWAMTVADSANDSSPATCGQTCEGVSLSTAAHLICCRRACIGLARRRLFCTGSNATRVGTSLPDVTQ